jgi:hypothetical protein
MPALSVGLIQMAVVALMLIASMVIIAKPLFSGERSMLAVADQWLHLWCGAMLLLCILEAAEWGWQ